MSDLHLFFFIFMMEVLCYVQHYTCERKADWDRFYLIKPVSGKRIKYIFVANMNPLNGRNTKDQPF